MIKVNPKKNHNKKPNNKEVKKKEKKENHLDKTSKKPSKFKKMPDVDFNKVETRKRNNSCQKRTGKINI